MNMRSYLNKDGRVILSAAIVLVRHYHLLLAVLTYSVYVWQNWAFRRNLRLSLQL